MGSSGLLALIAALIATAFFIDISLPAEVTVGMPYALVALLAAQLPRRRHALVVVAVTTILSILGFFLSPPGNDPAWMGIASRGVDTMIIWVIALLALANRRERDAARDHQAKLQAMLQTVQSMQSRALQAERLAAIGQMNAVIAHESRNALQRIRYGVELLQMESADNARAQLNLTRIEQASDSLVRLFEEVRDVTAPVKPELADCCVGDVWRRAWAQLDIARQSRAVTFREIGDLNMRMALDAARFSQVFRNLFENSLAACADPVEIEVSCHPTETAQGKFVRIDVRDNGPGLAAAQTQRLFEPFYTTKRGGSGLGLAVSRRIVEAHGGRIVAETGRPGAQFSITLPVVQMSNDEARRSNEFLMSK